MYPDKAVEFQVGRRKSVSEFDHVGLLHVLVDRFSKEDLNDLCFKFDRNLHYDEDIGGTSRESKAVNLIRYLERHEQIESFYDFMNKELVKQSN